MPELWLGDLFEALCALVLFSLCVAYLQLRISTPVFALGVAVVLAVGFGWFIG